MPAVYLGNHRLGCWEQGYARIGISLYQTHGIERTLTIATTSNVVHDLGGDFPRMTLRESISRRESRSHLQESGRKLEKKARGS